MRTRMYIQIDTGQHEPTLACTQSMYSRVYAVFLALAMGFRPVAKDSLIMTHCKPLKKIKPNFFLGLALKTCIEGNRIEKNSLYSHKASKIKGLRGVQKFSPIQPEQMFGARYDPHIS